MSHEQNWSGWLDAFRWFAAAVVMQTHAGRRLLLNYRDVHATSALRFVHLGVQFPTGFSHQAVMVVFALSGFFVGGSALAEFRAMGDIDLRRYSTKRLVRLWLVLLPILALGAAFDLTVCTRWVVCRAACTLRRWRRG